MEVPLRQVAAYDLRQVPYFWVHYVLRQDLAKPKPLRLRPTSFIFERQFQKEQQHEPTARF